MSKKKPLLVAPELRGRAFANAHAGVADEWFQDIARQKLGSVESVALIAVGGYGRGELCPRSDIDVVLVHDENVDGGEAAEALWYPAWDRGLDLGYIVATLDQLEQLLVAEFEWSTALLDTRLVVGSAELATAVDEMTGRHWRERRAELMVQLDESVEARHRNRGDAASFIEPDLKEGRGGLRDVHAMAWASRATPGFANEFLSDLEGEVDILLEARVELHRLADRRGDVLHLDNQDGVAEALDYDLSQDFMHRLSKAARRVAWRSDEAWSRWRRAQRAAAPRLTAVPSDDRPTPSLNQSLDPALLVVGNGVLALRSDADIDHDSLLLLKLAVGAVKTGLIMSRDSLAWLQRDGLLLPDPWPSEARYLFAEMFLHGRSAIPVVEDLDQFGLMQRLVPDWSRVYCRPQRNVFHTYTVDRHLCETAANAAELIADPAVGSTIIRPDLLVVGALFHDIGKGFPGDHTDVGVEVIGRIAERMGYPSEEIAVLVDLCRHHLLLPDVATRRDLTDPGTVRAVAAAVDSVEFLHMLAALTEADSKATGPSAWGTWKAGLLRELVRRTEYVLSGGSAEEVAEDPFPSEELQAHMEAGERYLIGKGTTFTAVTPDFPGFFSTMAGVLAVCGLDVLDAASDADEIGAPESVRRVPMGVCQFELQPPASGSVDWDRVIEIAGQALDGRVALRARVNRRAAEYSRFRRRLSAEPPRRMVIIDNEISDLATVVEVHASDGVGLLYNLTQVIAELQLDIRKAKIQTVGPQAVDSFYLSDQRGKKIADAALLSELELGLREVIGSDRE